MTEKDTREMQAALAKPFAPEDLEWRLQNTIEESMRGMAVPYVTNRAIQNRLDEVCGPENWYNEFKPWHSNGKKDAQLCGIAIYFEGKGFITKWDGAEDSDIEPIKGGLSDSMKRAAYQWGIGRVLYSLDTVWVDIERRGRSYIIKASERKKLDDAYLNALKKLGLEPAAASGIQSLLMPKTAPEQKAAGDKQPASAPVQDQRSGGTAQQSAEPQNRSAQQKPQAGPKKQEYASEPTGKTVPFRNTAQATEPLAEIAAKVNDLGTRYKRESVAYKAFHAGMDCPTCHRRVTEETLPEVQAALKKNISELYAAGTEQKGQLTELQEMDKKARDTFDAFKEADLRKWTEDAAELERRCAEQSETSSQAAESLRSEIQALTAELEYGNLTQAEYGRLRECREQCRELESKLSALNEMASAQTPDFDREIREAQEAIGKIKRTMTNVISYVSKRAELTFSQLKMNRVEISLYDVVKSTGEVKDTFKFTYSGRRYDRLSLSEKIRAGMELSELIKRLTGRNYPVFVDNMESVDDLANVRPTGQIIMAKCVSNAPLQVRPIKPIVFAEQRAA